jgi:hypothetical protein
VVRHEQGAALGGDVLDALLLDPEPVAVVEVQDRLDELEDALRPPPVVERPRLVRRRQQLAQRARVLGQALALRRPRLRQAIYVVVWIEVGAVGPRLLRSCTTVERPAEQRAVDAQASASS